MTPRRSHKKSRNGCDQCKERRVKCNELTPCFHCTKRHLCCTYERRDAIPEPSQSAGRPRQRTTTSRQNATKIPAKTDAALESLQHSLTQNSFILREWGGHDCELMHHYCTVTTKTFSPRKEVRRVWKLALPQLAYSYEFLMHGILSLSGLHLAHLRPEKRSHYLTISTFHMTMGLPTFRTIIRAPSKDNCLALYGFSSLITASICATPTDIRPDRVLENTLELFTLFRGMVVIAEFLPFIKQSTLGPLLSDSYTEDKEPILKETQYRLFPGLHTQMLQIHQMIRSSGLSESESQCVDHAHAELQKIFRTIEKAQQPAESGMVFLWPFRIQDDFVELVERRRPIALILLAYYCAQLSMFSDYWFLSTRGEALLSAITAVLPREFGSWLDWPRQFCSRGNPGEPRSS